MYIFHPELYNAADFTSHLLTCKFVKFVKRLEKHIPKYFKHGFTLNTLYI